MLPNTPGKPAVTCIIVNYKNTGDTLETLSSLAKLNKRELVSIVVVDNESSKESHGLLSSFEEFDFQLITSEKNLGFTGGVNLGFTKAKSLGAQFVWLLNNDTIVHEDCLSALLKVAAEYPESIFSSLIYYHPENDRIWFAGGRIFKPWYIVKHLGKGMTANQLPCLHRTQFSFLCGCSLFIPQKLFSKLNGLDHSYFLYGEDVHLMECAKREGYQLRVAQKSIVYHKVSMASGGEFNPTREYYLTRNGYHLISRFVSNPLLRWFAYLTRGIWDYYRICKSVTRANKPLSLANQFFFNALGDFRRGTFGPKPQKNEP